MSTANSNLDNDPFPVFTPRSSFNTILQSRSPIPPPPPSSSQTSQTSSMNLIQQSPSYQNNSTTNRFSTSNQNLLRTPNTSTTTQIRHDTTSIPNRPLYQNNQQNSPNFVLANMVQNLSLNQQHNPKLQTSNNTTIPLASTSGVTTSTTVTHAHRKLFPLDVANHPLSGGPGVVNTLNDNNNIIEASVHSSHDYEQQNNGRMAPPDLSNICNLKRSDSYFMSDELRNELIRRNMISLSPASQDIAALIPPQIKDYHNLVPLDSQQLNIEHKSRVFNYQTISYKATHINKNCLYYLKVIFGFRLANQRSMEFIELWKKIQNANIITLRDVFGTKEFNGEHAIVFVYDYYPGLETLHQRLYNNQNFNLKGWANPFNLDGSARPYSAGKGKTGLSSQRLGLLPEPVIWDYIIQLTSIIRTIHLANTACRILIPSRLLIDHKSRLRLSGVGIFDVIDYDNNVKNNISNYQQEDLVDFGRIVLALACNSLFSLQQEHLNTSIEIITKNYSPDLRSLIIHFLTPPMINSRLKSINDAMPIIGARFYTCLDNVFTRGDIIENELSKEIENSRLFRLICKLNIILDRQDCGDMAWSETGDRYMLKLFRDYIFHQVNSNGSPWIDLSHIVQCLNKFDYGSTDKICLVSPDGQSIMIVTYAQLKKCFEKVFTELTSTTTVI